MGLIVQLIYRIAEEEENAKKEIKKIIIFYFKKSNGTNRLVDLQNCRGRGECQEGYARIQTQN